MAKSFRDLVAYQRAVELMVEVYARTTCFPRQELFGLTSQLRRASVGVMSQIAEGDGRLTYGEWRQFLGQARGSLYEVEAETLAAHRLHFLDDASLVALKRHIRGTAVALNGLIEWVTRKEREIGRRRDPKKSADSAHGDPVTR